MTRSNWRSCKDWRDCGIPMSTVSNGASKHFDAVLTQYVGWYEDITVGGIENSINKMMEADPNFVLGHVLKNGLELSSMSTSTDSNENFKVNIGNMIELAAKQLITDREKKHVSAVKLWADCEWKRACDVWEDILIDYPTDMLALKFAHDNYFCLGYHPEMRDSISRVLHFWKQSMPLYGYLLGMHAFGLEETCLYDAASNQARRALDINRHDAWATHALAHVYEMTGRYDDGIQFMSNTENDWKVCGLTACHNYWHYGLFYIEKGNFEDALGIFDSEIGKRTLKSKSTMEIVNSVSYLHRLKLEGVVVGDRFEDYSAMCLTHKDDHIMGYIDVHYLMACLGAEDEHGVQDILQTIKEFIEKGRGDTCSSMKKIGLMLCEALVAFEAGEYHKTVELLYSRRYQIINLGGSNAQRDVFNLFLIHAAIKSKDKRHKNLARMLLSERKFMKENSPLTDRMIAKASILYE